MSQGNSYEEARKQRLEDNKRRFQELGVLKMANSLSNVIRKKNKTPVKNQVKSKTTPVNPDFVRHSSRPRKQVTYSERFKNCKTSNIATRVVTYAKRSDALNRAMSFQSGLLSGNPSFVKSMLPSHIGMLSVPLEIRNHLPRETKVRIVLEDEDGSVYETDYRGVYGHLTIGWKTFFMDHKLDNGDALVIEIIEPTRLKVHIFKVSNDVGEVKADELNQRK
ncbi:hypothetical protein MKW98_017704 [Papaver atlanticum]|uniref:TF-B3 domain-containing protein n=1 Tax=Papaver atlanticum TaxID=357466 RepID=A0AAD4TES7_9MAGN|nr:hypothetical protein MKW98_017704 [Papaver atlanticum]